MKISSIIFNENSRSKSFIERLPKNNPYTTNAPTENYQWSEIKSSLLVQEVYHNNNTHKILVTFLQGIVTRICKILDISYKKEMYIYLEELKLDKEDTRQYPVGQPRAFLGVDPLEAGGLWNDFYGLWNFIKWLWINISSRRYSRNNRTLKPIILYYLIYIFQQQTLQYSNIAKGFPRDNITTDLVKDNHIGISNIELPETVLHLRGKPGFTPEPWVHPGNKQCKVPYQGKYGVFMKEYKKQNDFYASLQCGVSGSTQFVLFMYLLSISDPKYKSDTTVDKDIRNMITAAVLILTGDGGHNIREVIFGFVITVILLYYFIEKIMKDLCSSHSNIDEETVEEKIKEEPNKLLSIIKKLVKKGYYDYTGTADDIFVFIEKQEQNVLRDKKRGTEQGQEIFYRIIDSFTNWIPFINLFYEETKDINIMGFESQDLDEDLLFDINRSFNNSKSNLFSYYKIFLNEETSDYSGYILSVQLFFVLENSRFNRDINKSFKEVANEKIKHYIKKFPAGQIILETVDKQLQNILTRYKNTQNILTRYKNTHSPQSIPFAFKSKIASKSMEELRDICRKKGISGYSKYCKKDLVDFIVKKLKRKKS
jgi:hypothetical protein